jgi:hypothetical protein
MNVDQIVQLLRHEWRGEDGYLHGLRFGRCEPTAARRFLGVLESIDPDDPSRLDGRIVAYTWTIPFYMLSHIQKSEGLGRDGRDARHVLYETLNVLGRILGNRPALADEP